MRLDTQASSDNTDDWYINYLYISNQLIDTSPHLCFWRFKTDAPDEDMFTISL